MQAVPGGVSERYARAVIFRPPPHLVPRPFLCHDSRLNQRELEDLLRHCISYALKDAKFNRPKTHDNTEKDAYYRDTSELVIKQLRLSGWTLEPPQVIRKALPAKYG